MDDVERLNYVNGRRLDAADLRLEQDYLVAMRRRLNEGLFTPGVVTGFEVTRIEGDATHVTVAKGLALDPCGREIVLGDAPPLAVPAQLPSTNLGGYFLVISYGEEPLPGEDPDCAPDSSEAARIRERPRLAWTEELPFHRLCGEPNAGPLDCAVALALVSLDANCQISLIDISARDIARPAQSSQVQAMVLEGEKDIDPDNPKRLHFVIRGGAATSIVLFLWADRFSSLYYTQLGRHHHTLSNWKVSSVSTTLAPHTHSLNDHRHELPPTPKGAPHTHGLWRSDVHGDGVATLPQNFPATFELHDGNAAKPYVQTVLHQHFFLDALGKSIPTEEPNPKTTGDAVAPTPSQTQTPSVSADVDSYGTPTYGDARSGPAYGYFGDLVVELDGHDITNEIVKVLPGDFNGRLEATGPTHPFVTEGTDGIELTAIARGRNITLDSSQSHVLTFKVREAPPGQPPEPPRGGKIIYNLFVS